MALRCYSRLLADLMSREVGSRPDQMAQLRQATDSMAALTQQLHQLSTHGRRRTSKQNSHRAALLSIEAEQHVRDVERVMARLRPHIDQVEQRLMQRLDHVAVDHDLDGVQIDPTWVKRTVFVKDIGANFNDAQMVKDACARVCSEGDADDLIVNVSLRAKAGWDKSGWALVSFATERGAQKLLDEQTRKVACRLTGMQWTFLPYQPQKLVSHEAQARKFHSEQSATRWTETGLVGHAISKFKHSRKSTTDKRTVWVGGVPDHLARGGTDRFEQNMKLIFAEFGTIDQVRVRYKDAQAGSSRSWCIIAFSSQTVASRVLRQTISVPAHDTPGASGMVELELRPADGTRAESSPGGKAAIKSHIDAIYSALARYQRYLPPSHPTLVRMHAALSELHRRCGDEDEATYCEQEAKQLAKCLLLELNRVGDWSLYVEDESLMRELLKGDKEIEDLFRRRHELAESHSNASHMPHTNQLSATKALGSRHETPSRRWADG